MDEADLEGREDVLRDKVWESVTVLPRRRGRAVGWKNHNVVLTDRLAGWSQRGAACTWESRSPQRKEADGKNIL